MSLYIQEKPLKATVEKIDGDKAVLTILGAQRLLLPKKYLPKNAKAKSSFYIDFVEAEDFEVNKKAIARSILEEILQS